MTSITRMDFRTAREKERDARHAQICDEYRTFAGERPDVAPHRIFLIIAERHGMTAAGVRKVVVNAGLYTNKRTGGNDEAE